MKKDKTIDVSSLTITNPAIYEVEITGTDSILFNKMVDQSKSKAEQENQERKDPLEVERETWRERCYSDEKNNLYIPGENLHECLKEAAKYWGQRLPGEGKKTYTDIITKAIVCENLSLGKKIDCLIPFGKSVNSNPSKGKRSGSKVYRIRPLLRPWGGNFKIHVFDGRLTIDVLRVILSYAGTFIGLCDWRPNYGRFELKKITEATISS